MSLRGDRVPGSTESVPVTPKQAASVSLSSDDGKFNVMPNGDAAKASEEDDYWTSSTFLRESTVNFDEKEPTLSEGAFRLFGVSNAAMSSSLAKSFGATLNIYDFDDGADTTSHLSDEIRSLHSETSYAAADDDSTASATSASVGDNKRNTTKSALSAVASRLASNYFSSSSLTTPTSVTSRDRLQTGGNSASASSSPSVNSESGHAVKPASHYPSHAEISPSSQPQQQRSHPPPLHAISVDAGASHNKIISQLSDELRQLRKTIDHERRQRFAKLAPRDTISQLSNVNSSNEVPAVCLVQYQAICDKEQLLDEALQRRDYEAIIPVIMFLRQTLNPTLFTVQLRQRPEALQCYISFLKSDGKYDQCIDLLESVGRSHEAGMLELELALRTNNSHKCVKMLEKCSAVHLNHASNASVGGGAAAGQIASTNAYVNEYKTLIELQRPLKNIDARESLITTVYSACHDGHFDEPENMFTSPFFFRNRFRLSAKQFDWTAARALAAATKWDRLHAFFVERGSWLKSSATVRSSAVPVTELIGILFRNRASPEIISTYLPFVDDAEVRVTLSEKCRCYGAFIDACIQLKDRQRLLQLNKHSDGKIKLNPVEHKHLQQTLANPNIKWNT